MVLINGRLLTLLSVVIVLADFAVSLDEVMLPKPNGPFSVGMNSVKLVDRSRREPFSPEHEPRQIMTSIFYPVQQQDPNCVKPTPYLPPKTAAFFTELYGQFGVPETFAPSLRLPLACHDASTDKQKPQSLGSFPVVAFGTGASVSRHLYSVLAQSLSSFGYIVFTLDDTYGTEFVEFPDGSVIRGANLTEEDVPIDVENRAADVSFLLDQLSNSGRISKLIPGATCGLNVRKTAMIGHSLGGAVAAYIMLEDRRVAGGVNMDGAFEGPVLQKGLDKPMLYFGAAGHDESEANWRQLWHRSTGWKRMPIVEGTQHGSFSDLSVLAELLGLPDGEVLGVGSIKGSRNYQILTAYLTAFLQLVFKGEESPILQGPSDDFPEVRFLTPPPPST